MQTKTYFKKERAILALALTGVIAVSGITPSSAAAAVKLNKTSARVMTGEKVTLKLKGVKKSDYKNISWSVTKPKVIKLNYKKKTGKATVKGLKKGSAKVIAKYAGKKYSCKVTVKAAKNHTTSKIVFDQSWTYADQAKITSGESTLYTSTLKNKKNITVALNASYGTTGDTTATIPAHPDGSPKVISGSTAAGATGSAAVPDETKFSDGEGHRAATLNLTKVVRDKLLEEGYNVLMIRDGDQVALDNIARTVMANNNADLMITLGYDDNNSETENMGAFFCSVPDNTSYLNMTPVKENYKKHMKLGFDLISGLDAAGISIKGVGTFDVDLAQTSFATIPQTFLLVGNQFCDHSEKASELAADGIIDGLTHYYEEKRDPADSFGFVKIGEVIPDIIQEIRYYTTYNFVGTRIDGYEAPIAYMTREAAYGLSKASDKLKEQGYRLKIYDAYRPQMAVDHFVRWAEDVNDTLMKPFFYPELDKSVLFPQGYIDRKSGHSRGSTVDLTIFDMKTEKEVDMGGTFDFFGELSHPDYKGITDTQYNNRMILREAMLSSGYKPLPEEWWHFTLVDEPFADTYFTFTVR
ncbi:MAG: N-acetylmuramoyl-L-alanine amidase [Eubacterium sp.]|nr:N-acetylmuramoyl-L-alanine amidase [Eubacterium sp.]